jgi:hypothetical protein
VAFVLSETAPKNRRASILERMAGETTGVRGEREKTKSVRGTHGGDGIGPWEKAGLWARGPVNVETGPT